MGSLPRVPGAFLSLSDFFLENLEKGLTHDFRASYSRRNGCADI